MKIFLDTDFRCHTSNTGDLIPVETNAFDGKCTRYIQGYRFVPAGQTWTRSDGVVFAGEMIAPAEDSRILEAAKAAYEEAMATNADALAALAVLGVSKD